MLGALTEKFRSLVRGLTGQKFLSEDNIADAVRDVRLALLDADVNYTIVSSLIQRIKKKALGQEVTQSVLPSQQFIKILHDELVEWMGGEESALTFKGSPTVMLLCGLQGSGKTTQCVKLALHLQSKIYGKKVLVAACDLQRPAAVEQLHTLGERAGIAVFSLPGESSPKVVAKKAVEHARKEGADVLIVDTAGRLHIDEPLMEELTELKHALDPQEILFVASASIGQDAVKTVVEFDKRVGITGSIITMLDGDARAGAALSIREVTGKPIKFEGVGERAADFRIFNPCSMADRILGMGDIINLVRQAEQHVEEEESRKLEAKIRKATFSYDDYLKQMNMLKKMGSLQGLMKMLPGFSEIQEMAPSEKEFGKMEAMILSMTVAEREESVELSVGRRKRIAKGSGVSIDDVNRMVKGFKRLKQMLKGGMMSKLSKSFK